MNGDERSQLTERMLKTIRNKMWKFTGILLTTQLWVYFWEIKNALIIRTWVKFKYFSSKIAAAIER